MVKKRRTAVAYLRVSGRGQVEGHGFARQRDAIKGFAREAGYKLIDEFAEAHSGTDADRPVFALMIGEMLANGCRTIIVESLDRFARDLAVQIALLSRLKAEEITLISASTGEDVTAAIENDPMREGMVLVQGVFAQVEKKRLVAKLRKAREARRLTGRCEGRKPYGAKDGEAKALDLMRSLHRKPRNRPRRSFGDIAKELNAQGFSTRYGKPWLASTVWKILARG